MRRVINIGFLLLLCLGGFGQSAGFARVSDSLMSPSDVSLKGVLGQALQLSEQGRIRTLPVWNNGALITLLSPEARNRNTTTDWYGEHAGKWMYAASLAALRTGDDSLKALLMRTADYLVRNQEADGYMGSYSPALRITNAASKLHKRSWDVWGLSCTVLGLLEVNARFHDARYLESAKKVGELLLRTFGEGGADITDYGTRYGYSATVALDPVVMLYRATGDKRYLEFAKLIVREADKKDGLRLTAAMAAGRDLETVADGKVYQIIWNLLGLAKLYAVTGDTAYLKTVQAAWKNIRDYHLTITGGPWGGIGKHKECFNSRDYWSPYGFVETCSTMSWMQLNRFLLQLTGEAKYSEEIEKSAYNALLGAQLPDGQLWTYHSFTNGRKHPANYNDCCPSSGALALEELSEVAYTRREGGIAVNLYGAGEVRFKTGGGDVLLSQQTDYPMAGVVRLMVMAGKSVRFPMFLRIPAWVKGGVRLAVNGKEVDAAGLRAGSYFELTREWKKGDVVELSLPMALRVEQQPEVAIMPQGKDDLYRVNWFALVRGPLVYANDGLIEGRDREINFRLEAKDIEKYVKEEKVAAGAMAYRFAPPGEKPLVFRPFYEAGGREAGTWRLTWMQYGID
ncbi:MAG: glycoside hydrolase family 127 protein [Bacteroidetes bacterium]|nr:glycoside hydrolase family 127 protein [Bacteroidota bacterium]